jgi:hypothetical protein
VRAHCAGLALGTIGIYVTHRSSGTVSASYFEAQQIFRAKWGNQHYEVGRPAPALQA